MKYFQNFFFVLLSFGFSFSNFNSPQYDINNELAYEVNRIYPYISITKETLKAAITIDDFKDQANGLNLGYQSSWVKEFLSIEISTMHRGEMRTAMSINPTLTEEQKENMKMADVGTTTSVKVLYIPDNNLVTNNPKEFRFTFTIDPENAAEYPGGQQEMNKYLATNAIVKIPNGSFIDYDLALVKFSIDKNGQIVDAHIFESSKNEAIDELLLEAICNMPKWKPAEYVNGTKVKQEFVLTVGNRENCIIHLLNIHHNL